MTDFLSDAAKRRDFLKLAAATAGSTLSCGHLLAQTPPRVPIADMHSHLGVLGMQRLPAADVASDMKTNGAVLVAWKIVADSPWLVAGDRGISQRGTPTSQELWSYFETTATSMIAYAQSNQLPLVRTVADVDAALVGRASVVLASEGADFLGGELSGLKKAFDMGLRHLQLVHYIRTPVGDFSTESPVHNGLSVFGRDVVKACEAQNILVDLAHCSALAIDHALEVATKPMVWSHGWVDGPGGSHRDAYGFLKRRLSVEQAKKIAARGGVVGLWGLGINLRGWGWNVAPKDRAGYAKELAKLVNLLGADHVAFGTDISGLGENWTVNNYGHVREVVQLLEAEKLNSATLEKVAFGNYVRVLRAALPKA